MSKKKIFILLGHPDSDSFNFTLANEYERGATEAGHEVRRMNLCDMKFDPILHKGYRIIQEYEPDIVAFQENVTWADHLVIIYPSWWSTMPAQLKGLFDRAWMPHFAFQFTGDFTWKKLLKGKTARIIVTSDSIPLAQRIMFGDTTNELRRGILGFAGFKVSKTQFGYFKHSGWVNLGMWWRERIKNTVYNYGRKAK